VILYIYECVVILSDVGCWFLLSICVTYMADLGPLDLNFGDEDQSLCGVLSESSERNFC